MRWGQWRGGGGRKREGRSEGSEAGRWAVQRAQPRRMEARAMLLRARRHAGSRLTASSAAVELNDFLATSSTSPPHTGHLAPNSL